MQDALNEANAQLGIKSLEKMVGFLKDSNVFMAPSRTISSYLLRANERIIVTKFAKDKKAFFLTVNLVDVNDREIVECSGDHSAWGVIQMLTKRPAAGPTESFAIYKDGQKVPASTKLSAAGIKGAVPVDVRKGPADPADLPPPPPAEIKVKKASGKDKEKEGKKKLAASTSTNGGGLGLGDATKDQKANALNGFLMNRPTKEDLVKKNIISKAEAEAATSGMTPLKLDIFQQLVTFLENHIELQGIFRISGGLQDVRALYLQFGGSGALDLTSSHADPHTATGALKLYLREQKDPLIPFSIYSEFLKAQRTRDPNQQREAIKSAVQKLPEPNLSIVKLLMAFLKRISAKDSINLMNPQNLGIVFGPTIMWDPDTTSLNFENTNVQSGLVVSMINQFDQIFGDAPGEAAPSSSTPPPPGPSKKSLPAPGTSSPGGLPKRSNSMAIPKKMIASPSGERLPAPPAGRISPKPADDAPPSLPPLPVVGALPPPPRVADDDDDDVPPSPVAVDSLYKVLLTSGSDRKVTRSVIKRALGQEAEFIALAGKQSQEDLAKIIVSLMKHITKQ